MIEIERKFLVNSSLFKEQSHKKTKIIQGYLSKDPERTVRIRIRENKGFITIKGVSSGNGLSRYEWEKEIPVQEANELISLCLPKVIEKTRFEVYFNGVLFEVDEFEADHKGLVLAEVELESETEAIELPPWIDEEVTGKKEFYNSYLSSSS
jgi:adenylate cyclase